jgi:hypothetical protein
MIVFGKALRTANEDRVTAISHALSFHPGLILLHIWSDYIVLDLFDRNVAYNCYELMLTFSTIGSHKH